MAAYFILLLILSLTRSELTDHMQEYERECLGEDKFPCGSGECIPQQSYCDGVFDCRDYSDENFCQTTLLSAAKCIGNDHFLCKTQKECIPKSWLCNNITDCPDGSDEQGCTHVEENPNENVTCIGFLCDENKCISNLWVCDGFEDCRDNTDEDSVDNCRHHKLQHVVKDVSSCEDTLYNGARSYRCMDSSYCLPRELMCNGLKDCRDGSDEGPYCKSWHEMCVGDNNPCTASKSHCIPERYGPTCVCEGGRRYNISSGRCDDVDECAQNKPHCSHSCHNIDGHFVCTCDDGYHQDENRTHCYAEGPEAVLYYSTGTDMRYFKVKSNRDLSFAEGIKQVGNAQIHGLAFDGKYLYWVQTADRHRTIFRAQYNDVKKTKRALLSLGLEDPGFIAIDWVGGHIYFSDVDRGTISACRTDGSGCVSLNTNSRHPRFVTLGMRYGKIFWHDYLNRPVIMWANMDGSESSILVDHMQQHATSLALDEPNGRLYYVEREIKVVRLDNKRIYTLQGSQFQHPLAVAVFENKIYWSDRVLNAVFSADKLNLDGKKTTLLANLSIPVFELHIYHPILLKPTNNPCAYKDCSHLCLVSVNRTGLCVCPYGMELSNNLDCVKTADYRPQYLVVAGGDRIALVELNTLGNVETRAIDLDIGRLRAMAYDNRRDTLYIYDMQRKAIDYINMTKLATGKIQPFMTMGFDDVVDMEYDYVTDNLYILDAGKNFVEAVSLTTHKRALLTRFPVDHRLLSFCLMPEYGRMLVALVDIEHNFRVQVDSIGMNGEDRKNFILTGLSGARVRLRYNSDEDMVYIGDDFNMVIETVHPEGTGRESFRRVPQTLISMAMSDAHLFWTDHSTSLYWTGLHRDAPSVRSIKMTMFAPRVHLYLQATSPQPDPKDPLAHHPCIRVKPCSDVCLQTSHPRISRHGNAPKNYSGLPYTCHCTPGLLNVDGQCKEVAACMHEQLYCHKSNTCADRGRHCDGIKDCPHGEDEDHCMSITTESGDIQIRKTASVRPVCEATQFKCVGSDTCIALVQLCDGTPHCPDGSDEDVWTCKTYTCAENEFRCAVGSCIRELYKCDGENDCSDGSDELDCDDKKCGLGYFECHNRQCIELRMRCDGNLDCADFSDEKHCFSDGADLEDVLLVCSEEQYACPLNRSICLPLSARCNKKEECPGGSDEWGCESLCASQELFECKQEKICLNMRLVCDNHKHCRDGSDETPEACRTVNMTSRLIRPGVLSTDCENRFLCENGQCVDWANVCDNVPHCGDGSDEGGKCKTACINMSCEYSCQRTPKGGHCKCFRGLEPAGDGYSCRDQDECARSTPVCAQRCVNTHASFRCACHHGYALRPDQRTCKAAYGELSLLYMVDNTVWSSSDSKHQVVYNNTETEQITAIAVDVRKEILYVTIREAGKLIQVTGSANKVNTVTNIGTPTVVSVDWITGNVYFVDSTPGSSCIRVCNVALQKCARLQKIADNAQVTALVVDPPSGTLFYCAHRDGRAIVWSSSLAGQRLVDVTSAEGCSGLAVDSFAKRLFLAENGHSRVISMDFKGKHMKVELFNRPELVGLHDISLFEDSLYFLVNQSVVVGRCPLFMARGCEPVERRVAGARSLVLRHPSVQRDDVSDPCAARSPPCAHLCVAAPAPLCLCGDGAPASAAAAAGCAELPLAQLPWFNGQAERRSQTNILLTVFSGMVVVAVTSFLFFYCYYYFKRRIVRSASRFGAVRYTTVHKETGDNANVGESAVSLSAIEETGYINPLLLDQSDFSMGDDASYTAWSLPLRENSGKLSPRSSFSNLPQVGEQNEYVSEGKTLSADSHRTKSDEAEFKAWSAPLRENSGRLSPHSSFLQLPQEQDQNKNVSMEKVLLTGGHETNDGEAEFKASSVPLGEDSGRPSLCPSFIHFPRGVPQVVLQVPDGDVGVNNRTYNVEDWQALEEDNDKSNLNDITL